MIISNVPQYKKKLILSESSYRARSTFYAFSKGSSDKYITHPLNAQKKFWWKHRLANVIIFFSCITIIIGFIVLMCVCVDALLVAKQRLPIKKCIYVLHKFWYY